MATQRSCAKCRAAGRQAQALGHKGGNCPYEIIYVSDDDAAIEEFFEIVKEGNC